MKNTHNATQLDMIAEPGEKLDFYLENVYTYEEGLIRLAKGGDRFQTILVNMPDAIGSRRLTSGEKFFRQVS